MRLRIVRDAKIEEVDVDPDRSTVTVDGRRLSYRLLSPGPARVELEIAGERVNVEGWPEGLERPAGPVDVNGERWNLSSVEVVAPPGEGARPTPAPFAPPAGRAEESLDAPSPAGGIPVLPPMPGRVIEVRVREGERVEKGQVLLVLEAMKMRNEIVSPAAGSVRGLRVAAGSNVRAREAMLSIFAG